MPAIVLDAIVLGAFLVIKAESDMLIVVVALIGLVAVFGGEWLFLRSVKRSQGESLRH